MVNILFDCDNTFGIKDCDVDDGLALLYLLGSSKANLLGITTTFGNSDIETVYCNSKKMMQEHSDIPVLKGCGKAGERHSKAVEFLVETCNRQDGNIAILATGSLTNLYGAYCQDPDFFGKVERVCLMGGLTEPLLLNGKEMDELNFSCDPHATYHVLAKARNIAIATGNNCLDAFFSRTGYECRLCGLNTPVSRYIYEKAAYWFARMAEYDLSGFYNWDVVAAVYLLEPDLFTANISCITPDILSLKNVFLMGAGGKIKSELPRIIDPEIFEEHVYQTWLQVKIT